MIKYVYKVITDNKAMFTRKTNKNIIEINNTREVFMIYLLVDKIMIQKNENNGEVHTKRYDYF